VAVYVSVWALKEKQLELSTLNLVHIFSVAVAWNALTQRSKGHGHTVTKTDTVACFLVNCATAAGVVCARRMIA